mmetsp:Transcript_1145/g.1743  ORF Transcript_1145/g.1743 Transcript_1145/m.1743 type:complete len:211 (+) Transcript_1145:1437-2069(+)
MVAVYPSMVATNRLDWVSHRQFGSDMMTGAGALKKLCSSTVGVTTRKSAERRICIRSLTISMTKPLPTQRAWSGGVATSAPQSSAPSPFTYREAALDVVRNFGETLVSGDADRSPGRRETSSKVGTTGFGFTRVGFFTRGIRESFPTELPKCTEYVPTCSELRGSKKSISSVARRGPGKVALVPTGESESVASTDTKTTIARIPITTVRQ